MPKSTIASAMLFLALMALPLHAAQRIMVMKNGLLIDGELALTHETEANSDALQQIFPDFKIRIEESWGEGTRYFKYVIYDKGRKVLEVDPGAEAEQDQLVQEFRAYAPSISDWNGIRPGDTYDRLRSAMKVSCALSEEAGTLILCSAEGMDNVQYVFLNPERATERGEMGLSPRLRIHHIRWFWLGERAE